MSKKDKCCENMLDEFGQPSLYCCHENGLEQDVPFPEIPDNEKGLYVTASGIQRDVCCEDEGTEYCCERQMNL